MTRVAMTPSHMRHECEGVTLVSHMRRSHGDLRYMCEPTRVMASHSCRICEGVMATSFICVSHDSFIYPTSYVWAMTRMDESSRIYNWVMADTYEWVMSHVSRSHGSHIWMSHVAHMNGSWLTHILLRHVALMNESWLTHLNESRRADEWFMARTYE